MAAWLKIVWAAAILVVPGGFVLFAVFAIARALRQIRSAAQVRGGAVSLRHVLAEMSFRQVLREARATL